MNKLTTTTARKRGVVKVATTRRSFRDMLDVVQVSVRKAGITKADVTKAIRAVRKRKAR